MADNQGKTASVRLETAPTKFLSSGDGTARVWPHDVRL